MVLKKGTLKKAEEYIDWKEFEFSNGSRIRYPADWVCMEDPETNGDTIMFYKGDNGLGTLRVNCMSISDKQGNGIDATRIVRGYQEKFSGSKLKKVGGVLFLNYLQEMPANQLALHWTYLAKDNCLILISFTVETKDKGSPQIKKEMSEVEKIIKSIEIL